MCKNAILVVLILAQTCIVNAQDFDSQLERLAEGLSKKLTAKGKTKVAVWGFFTENGEKTALGNYLTEDFSVYLTNFGDQFEVIDRNHLNVLLDEHKLNAEGYIDENTAKELGKIIAVDVIITGTYTVLNSVVKVRAKALDSETALQFAASMGNLPLNENIASYLGVSVNGSNSTNRGFNVPLNSNETINDPKTINYDCSKNRTGDVCFSNSLKQKIIVQFDYHREYDSKFTYDKTIVLDVGETKCFSEITARPIYFYVALWNDFIDEGKFRGMEGYLDNESHIKYLKDRGELKVETCKSKTYTIK